MSDVMINMVMKRKDCFRKYVENDQSYKKEKIKICQLYERCDRIEADVLAKLLKTVFHNIDVVKEMYKNILSVNFSYDLTNIYKALLTRHEIVHRNGKDKEGNEVLIYKSDIESIIKDVVGFIDSINS